MANVKMNKKDYYKAIIAYLKGEDTTIIKGDTTFEPSKDSMIEFLENEKALLEKKASNKAPTATQKRNLELKEEIYKIMVALGGEKIRSADIMRHSTCPSEVTSTPKVTALMTLLKQEGRVTQITEKGAAFYSIAK